MTFHTALIQRAGVLLNFAISDLNMCPSCDVMRKQRRRAVFRFSARNRAQKINQGAVTPGPLDAKLSQ